MPAFPLSEPEMAASFGSPVAFDEGGTTDDGAASNTGSHRSPRGSRRARRQAEKDAARAAASTEAGGLSIADSPALGDDALEPVLAPNERRLLSRLTANRLAEV